MAVKISVIMTTFNCIEHIRQSVESFYAQSLSDIELICIDGGSKDGTIEFIKSIQKQDGKVHLFPEEGIGIGGAKNTGIRKATGEFITFLDADDQYVDPSALEKMYNAAKAHNVKVCGAFRSMLFPDGHIEENPLHHDDCEGHPEGVLLYYKDRQYDYHFHSYIYERKMLFDSKAEFAEAICYDDPHFFIRAMLAAEKFYVVPVELYRYLMGPPYYWDEEHTNAALNNFVDELTISSQNGLEQLHYLTIQRMNNEYKENFVRNVRNGDIEALRLILEANDAINPELIDKAKNDGLPKGYLEAMYFGQIEEKTIITNNSEYAPRYMLTALADLLYKELESQKKSNDELNEMLKEKEHQNDLLNKDIEELSWQNEHVKESISYKLGRGFTYLPRKIRAVLKK